MTPPFCVTVEPLVLSDVCSLCSVGSGSWTSKGIETINAATNGTVTSVECESTHLTSFAVLVDVAGGGQVRLKPCHTLLTQQISCHFELIQSFRNRVYLRTRERHYKSSPTLDVPSLLSASQLLLFSFYWKGKLLGACN